MRKVTESDFSPATHHQRVSERPDNDEDAIHKNESCVSRLIYCSIQNVSVEDVRVDFVAPPQYFLDGDGLIVFDKVQRCIRRCHGFNFNDHTILTVSVRRKFYLKGSHIHVFLPQCSLEFNIMVNARESLFVCIKVNTPSDALNRTDHVHDPTYIEIFAMVQQFITIPHRLNHN